MKLIAEFSIPDLPKMTNSSAGRHWTSKYGERIKWQRLVGQHCDRLQLNGLGLAVASLTCERHSCKEPDYDGLVSGFKVVIDSLVKCGVIIDDKMSIIGMPTFKYVYRTRKQGGMILVRIET